MRRKSDAHSLAHVARAFTTVSGARSKQEFLAGLRVGRCQPAGRSGSYGRLTTEIALIFAAGCAEAVRNLLAGRGSALRLSLCAALAPFLPLIPLFTVAVLAASGRRGLHVLAAGTVSAVAANALLLSVQKRVRRPRPCDRSPRCSWR